MATASVTLIRSLSAKLAEAERDAQGWAERAIRQADICDTLRAENERLRECLRDGLPNGKMSSAEFIGFWNTWSDRARATLKGEKD